MAAAGMTLFPTCSTELVVADIPHRKLALRDQHAMLRHFEPMPVAVLKPYLCARTRAGNSHSTV
jgi:hypothetical protein